LPSIGTGGLGGGGNASQGFVNGQSGGANTGGGGGAMSVAATTIFSGNGGSGVVILRYSISRLITVGPGLTHTTSIVGANKVTVITAGTGNVSWV
jgi:hypothetical protein